MVKSRILHVRLHLTGSRRASTSESHPTPGSSRSTLVGSTHSSSPENVRKRKGGSEYIPRRNKQRLGVTSTTGRVNLEFDTKPSPPTQRWRQGKQPSDVGLLLMDLLSLHPHVTFGLVDRNRIQFYYASHAITLVSSVIGLSLHDEEGSIDRLIAVLIAFRRISLHNQADLEAGQNGMVSRLQGSYKVEGPLKVELGVVISTFPSLVERSAAVVRGVSPKWSNFRLVVKISWVDDSRVSEREFMDKAVEEATKPGHEWALNHLPRFFYTEDLSDPTYKPV